MSAQEPWENICFDFAGMSSDDSAQTDGQTDRQNKLLQSEGSVGENVVGCT